MRIDPFERELLRARALDRWHDAKAARHQAQLAERVNSARSRSAELLERADTLTGRSAATVARATRLAEELAVLRRSSADSSPVELLADRAIRAWRAGDPADASWGDATAMVASSSMGALLHLKEILATRVPHVAGATDAGTALGLAIVTQPDLAVIDARLELASGTDLALALPLFAPQTRTLVLTDDPERAQALRVIGFDTEGAGVGDDAVLTWLDKVA